MTGCRTCAARTALIAIVALSSPTQAADGWLASGEIASLFSGATLRGNYANGREFSEYYHSNGRVEYSEPGLTTAGRWSATTGALCTIYDADPSGGCFLVMRASENCYEFYFSSRTEARAPEDRVEPPAWTARGSLAGRSAGCADAASV